MTQQQEIHNRWKHKQGTPETLERASHAGMGDYLVQRYIAGEISAEELAAAEEISCVYQFICSDVMIKPVSYEPRIDKSYSNYTSLEKNIFLVRLEISYTRWRAEILQRLQGAKNRDMIMEMIVNDPQMTLSAASQKYMVAPKRVERLFGLALKIWMDIRDDVEDSFDAGDLIAAQAALL